jgi:hypothetical protein
MSVAPNCVAARDQWFKHPFQVDKVPRPIGDLVMSNRTDVASWPDSYLSPCPLYVRSWG